MIKQEKLSELTQTDFKWFDVVDIDEADIRELKKSFKLTPEITSYVSDLNERPHYDYDEHTDSHLLVYDVPLWSTAEINHFTTRPIVFLIHEKTVFSFHTHRTNYVFEQFEGSEMHQRLQNVHDITEFVMLFLFHSTQYFQRALTQINTDRNQLDRELNNEIANRDLRELAQIEKSLVYLSSSISTNLMMLQDLGKTPLARLLTPAAFERLDDILIESKQSSQMVKISNEVTEMLSKTSNNILNNNLNDTMKFLTVWSLLLTIPTIITGFFGMNVNLPLTNNHWAWLIIIVLNVGFMIWLFIYMKKHHFI
ncbi:magnesium transporter CorA family protein [Ligilactobacillus araffinosus]|uniref:CorA-family cationic transporter n=1 Tax=Ligilactobacillus araffinosus DSM 20653 TaxID=1423820 RepID=A0A0R1ZET5_9LACO|nr:magnesium transporter CorA family protein [Ligilactobacillus araffinosus]KRM52738.1 corA-family cationic transporter [Ligilactobacillus araffinosus DSM 20653]